MTTPWSPRVTRERLSFRGWLDTSGLPHIRQGDGYEMSYSLQASQLVVWAPRIAVPYAVDGSLAFQEVRLTDPDQEALICMHPFALLYLLQGEYLPARMILEVIQRWERPASLRPAVRLADHRLKLLRAMGLRRMALMVATDFDYSIFTAGLPRRFALPMTRRSADGIGAPLMHSFGVRKRGKQYTKNPARIWQGFVFRLWRAIALLAYRLFRLRSAQARCRYRRESCGR